ncbi:MAG: sensor histidine kinase [Candidatus Xenobia bacterium]
MLTIPSPTTGRQPSLTRGRLTVFLGYAEETGKRVTMQAEGARLAAGGMRVESFQDNLEELLERRPELVLVSDLARANESGARHRKRYQDVEELLAAGIDVFATLDVQRIESLNDLVARLSGITVRETVPDRILDLAHHVELVDLSAPELRLRLEEGGNLLAMRELALRKAAELAGQREALASRMEQPVAAESILVCVSPESENRRLLGLGRRMTAGLHADWTVLYVETPWHTKEQRESVSQTLHQAEELGARSATITGQNVCEGVLDYARAHQVTRILASKAGGLGERLLKKSGDIDLHLIGETPRRKLHPYLGAGGLVALALLLAWPARGPQGAESVLLCLMAVLTSAVYWGRGPALVAAALSVLLAPFTPLNLAALVAVALVVSTLAHRARSQVAAARRRETATVAACELSQDLVAASDANAVLAILKRHGERVFGGVFTPLPEGLSGVEQAAAEWALARSLPAGRHTDTHSEASSLYLPLGRQGVVAVQLDSVSREQRRLLETFASQSGLALERVHLADEASRHELLKAKEKLQNALLNSVSHDLKTPLASITGALRSLREDGELLDDTARLELTDNACAEAERLNRLVTNLLDLTRLEGGARPVRLELCQLAELVSAARDAARCERTVEVELEISAWMLDFVLIHQVLVNLLDNALKYSTPHTPLLIRARELEGELELSVLNEGPPPSELERVFEAFFHGPTGGSGLGLSICQAIVHAHGGRIGMHCENGHTVVSVRLP